MQSHDAIYLMQSTIRCNFHNSVPQFGATIQSATQCLNAKRTQGSACMATTYWLSIRKQEEILGLHWYTSSGTGVRAGDLHHSECTSRAIAPAEQLHCQAIAPVQQPYAYRKATLPIPLSKIQRATRSATLWAQKLKSNCIGAAKQPYGCSKVTVLMLPGAVQYN